MARIVKLTIENAHDTTRGKPVRLVCKDYGVIAYHAEKDNHKKLIRFDHCRPGYEWEGWREEFFHMVCGSLFDAGYHIKSREWMEML